jgi:hypothetical protein
VAGLWGTERGEEQGGDNERTWLVHTLLKVTKAKVCASIEVGRSFLDVARGMSTHESRSCGMKARDSSRRIDEDGNAEVRYSCVL